MLRDGKKRNIISDPRQRDGLMMGILIWALAAFVVTLLLSDGAASERHHGRALFLPDASVSLIYVQAPKIKENLEAYKRLSPQEKARLKALLRRWKSLSPEQKRIIRQRLKRWESLPASERKLLKKRFRQWKSLPPEKRNMLMEKLRNWENLSPMERERLRRQLASP
jgi:hypothetical protein